MPISRLNVYLQGPIKDNPDKEIIDGIVESIKKQTPLLQTGSRGAVAGMFLAAPGFHLIYKTLKGRDIQILVMGIEGEIFIHIKELVCCEDVAWGFCDKKELSGDMLRRLQSNKKEMN